jgi:hypothetical protein
MKTMAGLLGVLMCGAFACSSQVQGTNGGNDKGDAQTQGGNDQRDAQTPDANGGNHTGDDGGSGHLDPLVGSWTFSGSVPARVTVTLTFRPDGSFTMVETVAPSSYPAGYQPSSCVTTDTYLGTYSDGTVSGTSTLDLTFTGGTSNAVVGCDAGSAGTPMTASDIASYRDEGLVPATISTYAMTSTNLVLTPVSSDTPLSEGCSPGPCSHGLATEVTTFSRLP